jgi:alpha-D-ribose 1-methylphosphonate 5-triphosphate synthase subunit PhnH
VTAATMRRMPSRTSHRTFVALMRSLAEPGRRTHLPASMEPALAMGLLALADVDTTFAIDDDDDHPWVRSIATVTGARPVSIEVADLVVLDRAVDLVGKVRVGTSLRPEDGAKVFIGVSESDDRSQVELSGPGVPGVRLLELAVPPAIASRLGAASGVFPAGFDAWLVAAGSVIGIPRTTRIEMRS